MAKRHHFGEILGHFSEHRGQSENRAPARTGAQFWRFRGTPKASIFEVFSKTIPSTSQEGTLEGPCEDFFRFLRILGGFWAPHWPPIFSILASKGGSGEDAKKSQIFHTTVAGTAGPIMSSRHVFRTGLEDSLTRPAAGSAWRGVFEQASLCTAAPVDWDMGRKTAQRLVP